MIPANDFVQIVPRPIDDRVRIRAITDQVPQALDSIILALGVLKHSLQRFQVCVNIAQDQVRHNLIRATSGGAPIRAGNPMVPIPRDTKIDFDPSRYNPSTKGVKNRATFRL